MPFSLKNILYLLIIQVIISCSSSAIDKDVITSFTDENVTDSLTYLGNFSIANKVFRTDGYFIKFNEEGTFETFGFCDICSGSGTSGTYKKKYSTIYMLDTVCYKNEPHFTDSTVFVDCEGSTMTIYYLLQKGNALYLSSNSSDTIDPKNASIDFSYPSYQLKEVELGLTNEIVPK